MCISIVTVIKNNKNRISFHRIFVPANHLIYNVLSFWEETCDQQWDLYVVYARMMMDLLKVIHMKQGSTIVDTVVSFVFWYTKHVVSNLPHVCKALVCYYYVNTDTIWKAPLNQVRKTRTFFKKYSVFTSYWLSATVDLFSLTPIVSPVSPTKRGGRTCCVPRLKLIARTFPFICGTWRDWFFINLYSAVLTTFLSYLAFVNARHALFEGEIIFARFVFVEFLKAFLSGADLRDMFFF